MEDFQDSSVAQVFSQYPEDVREKLMELRTLIFKMARSTAGVGPLEETLKWQQPSYLPTLSGSGTTIRIDSIPSGKGEYAMFFHCQTSLVESFRKRFGTLFRYQGNRAILFSVTAPVPRKELGECISEALTYHLRKRTKLKG